ncbi:leukotriene C4 synthase isoform X2 [Lampris incognitus]|uniref:leukotriene C4 synthase isoform X2 n=1 Tax=Lampris incognitus TaxID=2546036 RepID=UPI0024B4AFFB|nr:leukotriene C4 synthase isoform X2 [Lampris incognitus]
MLHPDTEMLEHSVCLAAVSLLGVLEQAYFSLQVISARRKFSVAPPSTSGPAEFERVYRAQANCSEYFPLFITVLWLAGLFFSQGLSSFCGLLYLYGRYLYFRGYCQSSQSRLGPMYFSAQVLWTLVGFSGLGILCSLSRLYLGLDLNRLALSSLGLSEDEM